MVYVKFSKHWRPFGPPLGDPVLSDVWQPCPPTQPTANCVSQSLEAANPKRSVKTKSRRQLPHVTRLTRPSSCRQLTCCIDFYSIHVLISSWLTGCSVDASSSD
ncbi:hypothetical protein JTE90_004975 [Oedothorax gibbosus]|uniref:Uncharacterized protein n=1 Tax=Oedothorax gibbosus TaxID=931172 RepID=A0AAV6VID6_9ARAC|nr:hypothetical protein JTE90_004975 [Oedothorax gibbosus]